MKNKTWYLEAEMLVALSAIFISLCALIATIYEANLERQNQQLSVWPRLQLTVATGRDVGYVLKVGNKGIGPAIIKFVNLTVDNETVRSWVSVVKKLGVRPGVYIDLVGLESSIISANEIVNIIDVKDEKAAEKMSEGNDRFSVSICYCSVHDDCWILKGGRTKEVSQCKILDMTTFEKSL